MMHGTGHKLNRDLHDPAKLAKLGAIQGAYLLLGPFGFGITAFEFIHQSGGDLSRVSAIEQISQERIEPVHKELITALGDKDLTVRAAAAKALMDYHDDATQKAVYALLADHEAAGASDCGGGVSADDGRAGAGPTAVTGRGTASRRHHMPVSATSAISH